jgi:hypothetical protein
MEDRGLLIGGKGKELIFFPSPSLVNERKETPWGQEIKRRA